MFATSSEELGKSQMCGAFPLRACGEREKYRAPHAIALLRWGGAQAEFAIAAVFKNDTPSPAGFKKSRPQNATFPLTLEPGAGMRVAMNCSHRARRISVRTRRLSAGAWDMRIG